MNLYDDMEAVAAEANELPPAEHTPLIAKPIGADATLRKRIQALAQDFSIEVLPRTARKVSGFAELLPARTRVFIPFLPGARFSDCVPLAVRLRQEGMEPVPHLAARRLASSGELGETLDRLRIEAGVRQCLVIAGDPRTAAGPFADSLAVLETGVLEKTGMETIFVGGQPEGIPGVPSQAVEAALIRKNEYARQSSADIRLITQFTLDLHAFTTWQQRLGDLGNRLPVHIGIAGPTSLSGLLKFAALTGASASLRAMRRYGAKLTQLAGEAAPDVFIAHLARQALQHPCQLAEGSAGASQIAGLHVYTFGGFVHAATWMMALRGGRFTVRDDGAGFRVG
jgi:methylenetetrahydrofolate reductase (NADPH)